METQKLKEQQDKIHSIMLQFSKEDKTSEIDVILMNLITISKEINNLINKSIVGDIEDH